MTRGNAKTVPIDDPASAPSEVTPSEAQAWPEPPRSISPSGRSSPGTMTEARAKSPVSPSKVAPDQQGMSTEASSKPVPDTVTLSVPTEPAETGLQSQRQRAWRVWPSRNRMYCRGLCFTGAAGNYTVMGYCHDCLEDNCGGCGHLASACDILDDHSGKEPLKPCSTANLCAWFLIITPSTVYFVLALPYYWQVHFLLPMGAVFFFVMTLACLLLACCADPGIIPRREVVIGTKSEERLKEILGYDVLGDAKPNYHGYLVPNIPVGLEQRGYKWCSTCRIVRPPRASHCSDCDNCVLRFDHHCPFVNNCVGQRNYIFFMGFTTSVCFLTLFVIPALIWFFIHRSMDGSEKDEQAEDSAHSEDVIKGVLITIAAAAGLAALLVMGLWGYHIFLILTGRTTKEHMKGKKGQASIGENLTVFAPRGPILFDLRAWVDIDAFMTARGGAPASGKNKHGWSYEVGGP